MSTVHDLVTGAHVVVCCGTGGVGKTTTAAALALAGARAGRRVAVITIDPARRLADTLGLGRSGDTEVPRDRWDPDGDARPGGRLTALMLDPGATFDGLVARYSADEEQRDRILENRFYRSLAGALSGTQEYMAMERLHELHESGAFDLVVVDTPPSRHALDFLDAPDRLLRLLDNRMFRLLMAPTRAYLKVASAALAAFLRTIAGVVGREVVDDAIAFFQAFEGMEAGFRTRAAAVQELINDPQTAFVLVTSPRRDAVDEASFFAQRLESNGLGIAGVVVNRVHPAFGSADPAALRVTASETPLGVAHEVLTNLAEYREIAAREQEALAGLTDRIPSDAVGYVPMFDRDVHDLAALGEVAGHLL